LNDSLINPIQFVIHVVVNPEDYKIAIMLDLSTDTAIVHGGPKSKPQSRIIVKSY